MPSLLDLPTELRDTVFHLLTSASPPSPTDNLPTKSLVRNRLPDVDARNLLDRDAYPVSNPLSHIFWPQDDPPSPSLGRFPIAKVNRQLRAEFTAHVARTLARRARLDVVLLTVTGEESWCAGLALPVWTGPTTTTTAGTGRALDCLTVRVFNRTSADSDDLAELLRPLGEHAAGTKFPRYGPGFWARSLLVLLSRGAERGVLAAQSESSTTSPPAVPVARPLKIRRLDIVIDVQQSSQQIQQIRALMRPRQHRPRAMLLTSIAINMMRDLGVLMSGFLPGDAIDATIRPRRLPGLHIDWTDAYLAADLAERCFREAAGVREGAEEVVVRFAHRTDGVVLRMRADLMDPGRRWKLVYPRPCGDDEWQPEVCVVNAALIECLELDDEVAEKIKERCTYCPEVRVDGS